MDIRSIISKLSEIEESPAVGDVVYLEWPKGQIVKIGDAQRVIIEDKAEIGANCTIDRGVSGDTIIGDGTKIDNQVHLGHGVVVGKHCLLAAQVGVGGKTIIEDEVSLWGQVGVQKDILIEKGAVVLGQSGVTKSLKGNKVYFGTPAAEAKSRYRELTYLRRLPEFMDQQTGRTHPPELE
jgi:UDP-3-O-[3-hydroxymyristoyl] glucosamine N-acyltransferase